MSNPLGEGDATGGRMYPPTGGGTRTNINLPTSEVTAFSAAVSNLNSVIGKFAQAAPGYMASINRLTAAMGGAPPGGGGGGGTAGGGLVSSMFGSANERGWVRDFMMFPTRFMRSSITENRNLANMASAGLGMQAFGAGTSTQGMMGALAGQFGNVLGGSPEQLVNMMRIAGAVGAGVDWRYYANAANPGNPYAPGGNAPRTTGFFRSVYEAQRMNPGADVGQLAQTIGGYTANVGAQQQAAFLTGGAFSMIGAGNRQKSISEWATGILKWLQNLRGGPQRGQPFTYSELMSQNFPGSNIDAWLSANGVSEDMKQYFWSFALAQASTGHSNVDQLFTQNAAVNTSVAFNRLQASAATTRTGFRLAGTMAGAYANKEQANQFFAELMGHMMNQVLPSAMSSGLLSFMQYMPDTMEEIMMQLAERTTFGAAGAGLLGWGSGMSQMFSGGAGDVGDVGDFGPLGATSTAGLHPDMRKRVDAMMANNPRLRVTSGFRDLGTQQRLKRKGVGRVSGRPSAHTRGRAADLGPASEYPWIVRNARRFGLSSGIGHGEPWHVGMGDIPDISSIADIQSLLGAQLSGNVGSSFGSFFENIFNSMADPTKQIAAIGTSASLLAQAITGLWGGTTDRNRIAYRDVYSQLIGAANAADMSGLPTGVSGGGGWFGNIINKVIGGLKSGQATGAINSGAAAGGSATVPPAAGGNQSLRMFFTQVLQELGAPVTENNLVKLGAIAKTEGNRSGTFNPFNSTGGKDFPKFNSVGVRNYPNWETGVDWTVKLLSQGNTAGWRNNLMSDGAYTDWWAATNAFYTWGRPAQISQASATQMLGHDINAGDVSEYYSSAPPAMQAVRQAPMIFHNNFTIDGGGGANGGIDIRRTVTLLADQLESEMHRRMARRN